MPIPTPANNLQRLQRQASTVECWDISWDRATEPTARRLGITAEEAEAYILNTVRLLTLEDFVERVEMRGKLFDVYACYRDGLGWFVKIGEDDNGLLVISHHDPERGPLRTVSGRIVDVEEQR